MERTQNDSIIEAHGVSVTFDMERGTSRVLDDVSLSIQREEILGIVGESGSGKSMFASALLDAVVPPGQLRGDITYNPPDGDPVDLLSIGSDELRRLRWEDISIVFQGAMSSFNPVKTIRSHFVETLKVHDHDVEDGLAHARQLLSELYLEPERVLESYPHELSGGMKQRTLIALSLVLKPELLVMDEPTAALDLLMQRSIISLIENLKETYDLTIVFITHDLPLVAGLADRLAVMYAFKFAEIGPAQKLLEGAVHPYTRALLKAVPNLQMPLSSMQPIGGSSPDPVNVPEGCSYHPRCPLADELCRQEVPKHFEVTEKHRAACHHWEDSSESIPLDEHEEDEDSGEIVGDQSTEPLVSLSDVSVHFKQNEGIFNFFSEPTIVHAVDGVSLDIYEKDVVALVGESGCGKTTLGKTVIGSQRPTEGVVAYRGQDIWESRDGADDIEIPFDEIRRSLQIIHQDPGASLNPYQTIKKSLHVPLKQSQPEMNEQDRLSRILALLNYVGMTPAEDYAERYPHQLSGGEKQRVALIRALLMNPDLILADEAISALDVSLRVETMDLMLELQEIFNTSYVFISHNLSNARYLAGLAGGRIGVMYLGELVEIGPAEQIINDPRHPYTKVLKWSTADMEVEQKVEDPPIRGIDIPDPVDPPSGCRFHTRCPEARETCRRESPAIDHEGSEVEHRTACFREYPDDHPYWESKSLTEDDLAAITEAEFEAETNTVDD